MKRSRCGWMAAVLVLSVLVFPALPGEAKKPPRTGLRGCEPASVGMDAGRLAEIPERMGEFVAGKQISGAVTLVARRGCTVHLEAVGFADAAGTKPMRTNSLFAIASMTKPITATAIMILQDEGKLSVDDAASKYVPQLKSVGLADEASGGTRPPARQITIRDLMTHTSGVVGQQRCEATLEATVEEIAARPLGFEPGSRWQYSPGLNVCGRIIEVVSGRSYDEFLQERIFAPLKMIDTTFRPAANQEKRIAEICQPGADKKSLAPATHWLVDDRFERAPNPSGGLFSTAADMARFYQMILAGGELDGRRIVSAEAVAEMTRLQTNDLQTGFTTGNGWGLGWCVVRQPQEVTAMLSPGTFGHGGAFGTQGWVDPRRQMIFVLMIQRSGFGNSDASDIRRVLQQIAVAAVSE